MSFLHSEVTAGPDKVIQVDLDSQANVLLMDSSNFRSYKSGKAFRKYGGWAKSSPVYLRPPCQGRWYIVVDLGGASGRIRAGIKVLQA